MWSIKIILTELQGRAWEQEVKEMLVKEHNISVRQEE
jgi:hypothetical protein